MNGPSPRRFAEGGRQARRASLVHKASAREARYGAAGQPPPSLAEPAVLAVPAREFVVGDEVRVRGARCVVTRVGPDGVMVRGPRCPGGWIPVADVEEAA